MARRRRAGSRSDLRPQLGSEGWLARDPFSGRQLCGFHGNLRLLHMLPELELQSSVPESPQWERLAAGLGAWRVSAPARSLEAGSVARSRRDPSAVQGTLCAMTTSVKAGTLAAGASASASAPAVSVKIRVLAATASASAAAPTVVVLGPFAVLAYALVEPHYHVPAHHDDPVALGTEVGLALAVMFVGWKLVTYRLVRFTPSD